MSSPHDDPEFQHIIIGIVASIFLYISAVKLLTTVVGPRSMTTKIIVYSTILISALGVLWWLSRSSPKALPRR